MSIVCIDPGTRNTGIVYMDERRVVCAKTIAYKTVVKDNQSELMERAEAIARQVADFAADKPHEAIVIEGFVAYPGRQGGYTYQTPYLVGYLHAALAGEPIVTQTSRQVLNPRSKGNVAELKDMMKLGYEVWPECSKCTNDHTRSALAHGIYYYKRKGIAWQR